MSFQSRLRPTAPNTVHGKNKFAIICIELSTNHSEHPLRHHVISSSLVVGQHLGSTSRCASALSASLLPTIGSTLVFYLNDVFENTVNNIDSLMRSVEPFIIVIDSTHIHTHSHTHTHCQMTKNKEANVCTSSRKLSSLVRE